MIETIIIKEYLKYKLENSVILNIEFLKGQYKEKKPIGYVEFKKKSPLIVENILSKGPLIYIILFNENGYFYILHTLKNKDSKWQEYEDEDCLFYINITSTTSTSSTTSTTSMSSEKIWFKDPNFSSTLQFTSKENILDKQLNKIGVDVISSEFTLEKWNNILSSYKNKNIISILTNTSIISSVDNLIISEVLYYAKISPLKIISNLKSLYKDRLFEALRLIPRILYNKKILSNADYETSGIQLTYGDNIKIYEKTDSRRLVLLNSDIIYWDSDIQN